jgi:protein TonB
MPSLLLVAALQASLSASPAVPPPPRGAPRWLERPHASDLERHYPPAAAQAAVGGRVVLGCTADAYGGMTDCVVASETPAGLGFGQAALQLAPEFRLAPRMSDGSPVAGIKVRLPIVFQPPGPAPAPPPPQPAR